MRFSNDQMIAVLQGTKDRLFSHGWMKGDSGTQKGPNCIMGAMQYVESSTNQAYDTFKELMVSDGKDMTWVVDFNDDPSTKFSDIIDFLDTQIKNLEMEDQ